MMMMMMVVIIKTKFQMFVQMGKARIVFTIIL